MHQIFLNRKNDQRINEFQISKEFEKEFKGSLSQGRHASTFIRRGFILDSSLSSEGIIFLHIDHRGYVALQGGNEIKEKHEKILGKWMLRRVYFYDDITFVEKTTEGKESSIRSVVRIPIETNTR